MRNPLLVLVLVPSFAFAQETLRPRDLLPDDFRNIVLLDTAEMRKQGIWEALRTGAGPLLTQLERRIGPWRAIDRLTLAAVTMAQPTGKARWREVAIVEGNAPLAVPARITETAKFVDDKVGEFAIKRHERFPDVVFFQPSPKLQVHGSMQLLEPVLTGARRGGMPCADILSLTSGRRQDLLYFVVDIGEGIMKRNVVETLFPDVRWPANDEPRYLMARVFAKPRDGEVLFAAEIVVRHIKSDHGAGNGVAVTREAMDSWVLRARADPSLAELAELLGKAECKVDRQDVVWRIELGEAEVAARWLAMASRPLLAQEAGPVEGKR